MGIRRSISAYLNRHKLHPVGVEVWNSGCRFLIAEEENEIDVTDKHALITLNPFTVALSSAVMAAFRQPTLQMVVDGVVHGKLQLRFDRHQLTTELPLDLYEAVLAPDCYSAFNKFRYQIILGLKNRTNRKSRRFVVPPSELLKLFIYSLIPRPVYLVSVQHENGFDVFPIDLIGKVSESHVLLSIRTTSAIIPHLIKARKMCACTVAVGAGKEVYSFGGHHPGGRLPPAFQDFSFLPSAQYGIPIPHFAQHVMELEVEEHFTKGIHTQFLSRITGNYVLQQGVALAHTPWFNRNYFQGKFGNPK